jgi:hypothetical protein
MHLKSFGLDPTPLNKRKFSSDVATVRAQVDF